MKVYVVLYEGNGDSTVLAVCKNRSLADKVVAAWEGEWHVKYLESVAVIEQELLCG